METSPSRRESEIAAGHGLGFLQVGQHLLELAERVERATQLEAHIDALLPSLRRLGQVAERLQRLFERGHAPLGSAHFPRALAAACLR